MSKHRIYMFLFGLTVSLTLTAQQSKRPPRPGVTKAGVQRAVTTITPTAIFPVEGVPDWQAITTDAIWVANGPKNTVHRLDPKTNKVIATVTVGTKPCSGLTAGFGSLWVPSCGDKTLTRVDLKTNMVLATIPVGPADSEGGIATSGDSVWILSDPKGILSRIDPETNKLVAEIIVPPGSFACTVAEDGSVWVSSTENNLLARVDPKTNLVTDRVEVGPRPRFITAGGGSIWSLNQGDGSVSRVDMKSKMLVKNIEVGIPGGGGEIAFGEAFVWVTAFEIPLSQIDPATNQVIKQWTGAGGDSVRAAHGSVWLSNLREQNVWRIDKTNL